jgi:hypothetical protein
MGRISGTGLAAVATAACLASGCVSMMTTEWTGHKIDEAIKEFGRPDRTVPSADGKTMYVCNKTSEFTTGSWSGTTVAPTTQRRMTTRTFFVNPDGTIVTWNRQESQVY